MPELPGWRLQDLVAGIGDCLGANLEGVYLHGSLAMGDYFPGSSDIDLLLAVHMPPGAQEIGHLRDFLLARSGRPDPIELTVMTAAERFPWRHPAPFSWHYSEAWRAAMATQAAGGPAPALPATDPDLAAHVTMLWATGRVLYGVPIADAFPQVPREDFLDAVYTRDVARAAAELSREQVDGVLNLCRLGLYACEARLGSKREGALWALADARAAEPAMVREALTAYEAGQASGLWLGEDLRRFAAIWTAAVARWLDKAN